MDKSEILVHISAPSGAADDARYRAQVEAILNFQSHSRETIPLRADDIQHLASSHPITSAPLRKPETIEDSPLCIPASQSPLQVVKRHASQKRKDSLESPVSVIPDSQPQHQAFDAESLSLHPVLALSSQSPTSKRPRVGSPPPFNHPQHEVHQDNAEDRTVHAGPSTINPPCMTTAAEKEKEQAQPHPTETEAPPKCPILSLPLEIKPPPPPISTAPYTIHITPTLEMLTKRLKSGRTYNPTNQTRDLDNLERGYWYLHIKLVPETEATTSTPSPTSWTMPLFSKFWTFLSDFIAKEARAGWGVWCILEEENAHPQEATGTLPEPDKPHSPLFLTLKVYTWGEIACHIYLLLFLASDRRVRKMGAQWRDARDEVVIQMP
ncbi:hypothetical protein BDV12DRAFT_158975 [Aspergillus spectabilis]